MASSASVSVVLRGRFGPMGWSAVVVRLRHFWTVLGFSPWRAAGTRVASCDAWSSARTRGVVRALPCRTPAIARPPHLGTTHHDSPGPHTLCIPRASGEETQLFIKEVQVEG